MSILQALANVKKGCGSDLSEGVPWKHDERQKASRFLEVAHRSDNVKYEWFFIYKCEPSIAQLVVAEDCSWKADIFRSLVQVRLLGIFLVILLFFFFFNSHSNDVVVPVWRGQPWGAICCHQHHPTRTV